MTTFSEDDMRARFHDLGKQRDKILAKSGPLREKRDRVFAEAEAAAADLRAQIIKAEDGLFEIDQERAALSRALKGKTGEA